MVTRVLAFDVELVAGGEPARTTRFGGPPSAPADEAAWPECARCRAPLRFVGQIVGPLALEGVSLDASEAVQIFMCGDDECEPQLPDGPGSAAVVRRVTPAVLAPRAPAYPRHRVVVTERHDLVYDDDATDEEHAAAVEHNTRSKLGGVECASGAATIEPCGRCGAQPVMLAQLRATGVPGPSGNGWLFVFVCPEKHTATAQWVA